jgi:hypothetical protein
MVVIDHLGLIGRGETLAFKDRAGAYALPSERCRTRKAFRPTMAPCQPTVSSGLNGKVMVVGSLSRRTAHAQCTVTPQLP